MAKRANGGFGEVPFTAADFTKIWGEFKVPSFDVDAVITAQRKNIEAVSEANRAVAEGMRTVAQRQAELIQQSFDAFQKASTELMTITEPNDRAAKQTELTKVAFEQGVANAKELGDLVSKSTVDSFEIVSKRVVDGMDEVKTAIQKLHA